LGFFLFPGIGLRGLPFFWRFQGPGAVLYRVFSHRAPTPNKKGFFFPKTTLATVFWPAPFVPHNGPLIFFPFVLGPRKSPFPQPPKGGHAPNCPPPGKVLGAPLPHPSLKPHCHFSKNFLWPGHFQKFLFRCFSTSTGLGGLFHGFSGQGQPPQLSGDGPRVITHHFFAPPTSHLETLHISVRFPWVKPPPWPLGFLANWNFD